MNKNHPVLKIVVALITAVVAGSVAMLALPALADHGIKLSPLGVGAPDIEVNSDGSLVAMTYYKRGSGGGVYLKSADLTYGWRTRPGSLGTTLEAPRLAFSSTVTSTVYVTWIDSSGNQVRYARCNLSPISQPNCPESGLVYSSTFNLSNVDIAIDDSGYIHLVWEARDPSPSSTSNRIQTAVITSTSSLPLADVSSEIVATSNILYSRPRLATAGSRTHLTFLRDDASNNVPNEKPTAEEVHYYYSDSGETHSWVEKEVFNYTFPDNEIAPGNKTQLEHPAIAASGSNVFLAFEVWTNVWDSEPPVDGDRFATLADVKSSDGGLTWGKVRYITSTFDAGVLENLTQSPLRNTLRTNDTTPREEIGLRPNIAISGTGYAIAWQEIPANTSAECSVNEDGDLTSPNTSSEIYAAYTSTTWLGTGMVTDNSPSEYAIAPDVTVDPAGVRHLAYMRFNTSACKDGGVNDYAIYYTGPFTITANDQGESGGGPFLPIITKNS